MPINQEGSEKGTLTVESAMVTAWRFLEGIVYGNSRESTVEEQDNEAKQG